MRKRLILGIILLATFSARGTEPASQPTTQPLASARPDSPLIIPEPIMDPSTGKPRVPHPKPAAGETLSMTLEELGNFTFDPQRDLTVPDDVAALDGVKITLRGFITPFDQNDVLTEFALTSTLSEHSFAGVQNTAICMAKPELKFALTPERVKITGTLKVKVQRDKDYTHTVFQLVVDSMEVAK